MLLSIRHKSKQYHGGRGSQLFYKVALNDKCRHNIISQTIKTVEKQVNITMMITTSKKMFGDTTRIRSWTCLLRTLKNQGLM